MQIPLISVFFILIYSQCFCQGKALVDGQGCIRTKPSYSGEAIEFLNSGDTIVVLQYEGNSFYKVEYSSGKKRKIGYIATHFLKFPASEVNNMEKVTQSSDNGGEVGKSKTTHNTPARTIYTGPRGGRYYINSKGKKTYVKH